jgi:uncharacterized protein YwgA
MVQKLAFFLRETDVPLTYYFEPQAYGPYSRELANDVDELVFWNELESKGYLYEKGVSFSYELASELRELLEERTENFKTLVNDNFAFDSIELFGTVLYCIRTLQEMGITPSFQEVLKEFKAWKGEKYSEEKIQGMYQKIASSPLILPKAI